MHFTRPRKKRKPSRTLDRPKRASGRGQHGVIPWYCNWKGWVGIIFVTGALVRARALTVGWMLDDYAQRAFVEGHSPIARPVWDLYAFVKNPAEVHALQDVGRLAWWSDPELRVAFFRPVTSLLAALDYALFGRGALGPHLHSLLWWGVLLLAASALFRRVLPSSFPIGRAAVIALLLITGTTVSAWQAMRATQAEAAARDAEQEALKAQEAEKERAEGERLAKLDAEQGLFALAHGTGLELTVLRPPLVYGPGVKANFASMMGWVDRGIPFPLRALDNKRSFVFVGNLVDLVILCMSHPKAAGEVFLVSDDEDMSTAQLLRRMAAALGRPSRTIPVPASVLTAVATAMGQRTLASRLTGSLQVDIAKTRQLLGWVPCIGVDEGLRLTAGSFRQSAGIRVS